MKALRTAAGYSLVELVVGLGLLAIMAPVLFGALMTSREGKPQAEKRNQATTWLNETIDAVRSVRERGWSLFAVNGVWHPVSDGSQWSLAPGAQSQNGLTRQVLISDVYRNSTGTIVTSGGIRDPSTKRVIISVSWQTPLPASVSTEMYFTRYNENNTVAHTTVADFSGGTNNSTAVTNIFDGGEVVLASGGTGNWCAPVLTQSVVDLPKNGVANAVSAIEGTVYTATGNNASGVSFARVSLNQANPVVGTLNGTFDGHKTNDIHGDGRYAYLATDTNSKDIVIIDTNTNPISESGWFNAPGNGASAVYTRGNYGFSTNGSNLYVFDISSKNGSRSQVGNLNLGSTIAEFTIVGSFAYFAMQNDIELRIVDISNPANPSLVGNANVNGGFGRNVYVNASGTRAFLATARSSTQRELHIIDVSTKTGSRPVLGAYDTNDMDPRDVTVVTGNLAIIVGTGGEEYQVVNFLNEGSIQRCGGVNIDSGVFGIDSVLESDGDAFSYIITGDSSSELKIIAGGLGGAFTGNGTYTSPNISFGYPVSFNRMLWNYTQPVNTTLRLQVAVANPPPGGSCDSATYTYVGPNGNESAWYTSGTEAVIPFGMYGATYSNPGQCMRYRINMIASDPANSPIFRDITINYSP